MLSVSIVKEVLKDFSGYSGNFSVELWILEYIEVFKFKHMLVFKNLSRGP